MSRSLIVLVAIVVVVVGGLVALGLRSGERPLAPVEKVVQLDDLKK